MSAVLVPRVGESIAAAMSTALVPRVGESIAAAVSAALVPRVGESIAATICCVAFTLLFNSRRIVSCWINKPISW